MSTPQLVWFKRDLRLHDHAPLAEAARHGPLVLLWVWEPSLIARHDTDLRHLRFQHASLVELERDIAERGGQLLVRVGELPEVLTTLGLDRFTLWSHTETGHDGTYQRDLRVGAWCRVHGVDWHERPQNGVIRRLKTRDGWAARWQQRMSEPIAAAPARLDTVAGLEPGPRPTAEALWQVHAGRPALAMASLQEAGRREAERMLEQVFAATKDLPEAWRARGHLLLHRHRYGDAIRQFEQAVALDPKLVTLVAHGYTDLVTPYFVTRLVLDQVPDYRGAGRLKQITYPGGHMFYSRDASRVQFRDDVRRMLSERLGNGS